MQSHLNNASDEELRQRFRREREAKGWTQSDLADKLDSHWVTVSKLERGVIALSRGWITRLSSALGISVEMTVGGATVIQLDAMSIGAKIRSARKALDVGQSDVAEALGVTVQAVSQWERDENMPSGINLLKLHKLLSLEIPADLAGLEDVHLTKEALPENEAREGGFPVTPSRVSELLEYAQEVTDLLHALDKVGDGIGGADGFAVSAVALNAKSIADNLVNALKAMGAK